MFTTNVEFNGLSSAVGILQLQLKILVKKIKFSVIYAHMVDFCRQKTDTHINFIILITNKYVQPMRINHLASSHRGKNILNTL